MSLVRLPLSESFTRTLRGLMSERIRYGVVGPLIPSLRRVPQSVRRAIYYVQRTTAVVIGIPYLALAVIQTSTSRGRSLGRVQEGARIVPRIVPNQPGLYISSISRTQFCRYRKVDTPITIFAYATSQLESSFPIRSSADLTLGLGQPFYSPLASIRR